MISERLPELVLLQFPLPLYLELVKIKEYLFKFQGAAGDISREGGREQEGIEIPPVLSFASAVILNICRLHPWHLY